MRQRVEPPAPDQSARARLLSDLDATLLVEAAAGTGKTSSLVGRMVELIATGRGEIARLAAVTFTRKAAAELRSRFTAELERAAHAASGARAARLAAARSHADRCFIGTIHAFCARLLRERPIEAGVELAFEEIDDDADAILRERAWEEFVGGLFASGDPRIARLADLGVHLGQLKASFQTFAAYPDVEEWPAPEVRLGDLVPAQKALERYLSRIRALMPSFPTERGTDRLMARYESIERFARQRDLNRPVHLLEVLEEFDRPHGATQKYWPGGTRGRVVLAEMETWDIFREEVAGPFVARWREMRYTAVIPLLQAAVKVYDGLRAERGVLNFQDLLLKARGLLRDQPPVRAYFRARFTHLFVDEFQDTDPLQAEVLLYLTADDPSHVDWRACRPVPGSLFVVGDPKQSIYRFRRADIVTYQTVKRLIRDSGGGIVELDASFRTLPELVSWGNEVFSANFPALEDRYSPAAHPLKPGRPAPTSGRGLAGLGTITVTGPPSIREGGGESDEKRIARFIRHALDAQLPILRSPPRGGVAVASPATPGDFLIVTWRRKRLHLYGAALQQLGIPHQVSGGSAWGQVSELGLLAGLLRALAEPENPVALVGSLRGEVFGVSDEELYNFARAGGRFVYTAPLPEGLAADTRDRFEGAFARLRRYASWLHTLPPVAALERIAVDLGLLLRALAAPGGDGRAGCIGKAFAILRAQSAELGSTAGVVDLLERLIAEATPFDGQPARATASSVVRVMNLHKVKGLEAPVVFLADPGGKPKDGCSLHIDRTGERVLGYLAVEQQSGQFSHRLLAHPHGWDDLAEEEQRFVAAERLRLLYVAATRAGNQLIVTRRPGRGSHASPWEFFRDWLAGAPELPDPGPQQAPATGEVTVTDEDLAAATAAIAGRWRIAGARTYDLRGAKEIALSDAELHRRASSGEHGTEWGTVIHFLLEAALRDPGCDLSGRARAALAEQGLPSSRALEALAVVAAVKDAGLWGRATAAERLLVEVPFEICLNPGDPLLSSAAAAAPKPSSFGCVGEGAQSAEGALPVLIRGVIDLAFRETAGWVIVDWKTDNVRAGAELAERVRRYAPQVRLYADLWARITGEPVAETGLFFTATKHYEKL